MRGYTRLLAVGFVCIVTPALAQSPPPRYTTAVPRHRCLAHAQSAAAVEHRDDATGIFERADGYVVKSQHSQRARRRQCDGFFPR